MPTAQNNTGTLNGDAEQPRVSEAGNHAGPDRSRDRAQHLLPRLDSNQQPSG